MVAEAYSNQKNWSDTYLTDPKLIELLGPFDTDPCCPENMPWVTAKKMYTLGDNGLACNWSGRVFMNPPYRRVGSWAERFIVSEQGIALLNGRSVETRASQLVMKASTYIWFPFGRLTFYKQDGTAYEQKWFPSFLCGLEPIDGEKLLRAKEIYGGEIFKH